MQKRLSALLSCSLLFLLGFSGCCNKSCKKSKLTPSATKSTGKKSSSKKSSGSSTNVAALYNKNYDSNNLLPEIPEPDFNKLTFVDEGTIADFDVTPMAYDNNALAIFDGDDDAKKALNAQIDHLVSLWKAQDDSLTEPNDLVVDFRALYLDADKSVVPAQDAPSHIQQTAQGTNKPVDHAEPQIALASAPDEDEAAAVKIAAITGNLLGDIEELEDPTTKEINLVA